MLLSMMFFHWSIKALLVYNIWNCTFLTSIQANSNLQNLLQYRLVYISWFKKWLKPLQNKKGQKYLGYPRKKQSFYKETDCFFLGYPKFFGPSYFEAALVTQPWCNVDRVKQSWRSMGSYIQILCRFQKSKWKVPPPSLPC